MTVHLYACDTDDSLFLKSYGPTDAQRRGRHDWMVNLDLAVACPHSRGDIVLDHRVRYIGPFELLPAHEGQS